MSLRLEEREEAEIVERIGDDLRAAFARAEAAERRRTASRRLRKLAVATAALFTVVPTAVATRYIWAPDPAEQAPGRPFESSKPIQVGEGRGEVSTWRLSAFVGPEGLCWQMAVFNQTTSAGRTSYCRSMLPAGAVFEPAVFVGNGETFLYGWMSPRASRVEVEVAGYPRPPVTIVRPPADRIARAGLPSDLRFYVAVVSTEVDVLAPIRRTAYDPSGRVIASEMDGAGSASR